ncbi:MAG: hypothetical protein ACW99F_07895 [Candidatus Hodarchaeales archaeon]
MFNLQFWIIAKAEYRMATSRFRNIRAYVPYILLTSLIIWNFYMAPALVKSFLSDLETWIFSQVALILTNFILFFLFMIFFLLPIANILQDIRSHHFENIFSTPVKPGNLLLGEFLGKLIFYAFLSALIGTFFTAAFQALGIDIFQTFLILLIVILVSTSASWIGTVTAILMRSILMKTARGRDIGKGIAFIVIIPFVAIMYATMGGYFGFLLDPEKGKWFGGVLKLFPSSWGAEVIVSLVKNPGNILAIEFNAIFQLMLLVSFFIGSIIIGLMLSNRFYSLELRSFSASRVKPDKIFYRLFKQLLGGKNYSTMVLASWKNYFRTIKNLTMLIYIIALVVTMNIFLMSPEDSEAALVGTIFLCPLLGAFVAGEIALQGKESLLLYKQTPFTTWEFIKIKLSHYLLLVIPISIIMEVWVCSLVPNITPFNIFVNTIGIVTITIGSVLFSIGLFLRNPAYHDKAPEFMINIQVIAFNTIIPFFASLIFLQDIIVDLLGIGRSFYNGVVIITVINWITGLIMLYIGARYLDQLE